MGMTGKPGTQRRWPLLAFALLSMTVLATGLPARAQGPDQSNTSQAQPSEPKSELKSELKPARPGPDDPPPLNLGGSSSAAPAALDAKSATGRWSAYANAVQASIHEALAANDSKLNGAAFEVEAELWVNPKGHVTQARLIKSSGSTAIDTAFNREILPGLMFPEPDKDMPLPIRAHVTSKGPGHPAH
jgi:hypothetical protein